MLEVANSEHALFGVLSQSYSFRCFTADNDSTFGLFNAEMCTRGQNESASDSVKVTRRSSDSLPLESCFLTFGFSNC